MRAMVAEPDIWPGETSQLLKGKKCTVVEFFNSEVRAVSVCVSNDPSHF